MSNKSITFLIFFIFTLNFVLLQSYKITVKENLAKYLLEKPLLSLYVDYEKPYVSRLFYNDGENRILLHKIFYCEDASDTLFHPHPWTSAIKIIDSEYEMGIGHSETNIKPSKIDCRLILGKGQYYEMIEPDGWHYVKPNTEFSLSLMAIGPLNYRGLQPKEKPLSLRRLYQQEVELQLLQFINRMNLKIYGKNTFMVDGKEITIGI